MDLVLIQIGIEILWQFLEEFILPIILIVSLSPLFFLLRRTRDRSWNVNFLFLFLYLLLAFFTILYLIPWIFCNPAAPECVPFLRIFSFFGFFIYFISSIGLFFGVVVLHKKEKDN